MKILTFDIEDWFHILDNSSTRTEKQWDSFPSRIHANTDRILELLAERRQNASFFCLGWVARKYPEIVRKIDSLGHEIGSHTDSHQLVYEQNASRFAADVRDSIAHIEDVIGKKVRIFRAPGFSITRNTPWAFEALAAAGITMDSSVFPAPRGHGGFPSFGAAEPVAMECGGMRLKEFPINKATVLGLSFIFSGGGYFRLLPYPVIRHMMAAASYIMTYFHPRDFDAGQPVLGNLSLLRKAKSYVGLRGAWPKLRTLLDDFDFVDMRTADSMVDWHTARVLRLSEGKHGGVVPPGGNRGLVP